MKNIMVAVEPNGQGAHIWRVAIRTAEQHGAGVHLVNVIRPAVEVYADLNFAPLAECAYDWQQALARENAAHFATFTPSPGDRCQIMEGNPGREIARAAEQLDAELIVMGLHNRRGLQRLMGSTTHAVLNASDVDLLAVHPDSEEAAYANAMIAVDTTDLLPTVLNKATQFLPDNTHLNVITAMVPLATVFAAPGGGHALGWSFDELSDDIRHHTEQKVRDAVAAAGIEAEVMLRIGDPRDEIVSAAKDAASDVIVIGGSNRGALNRLLLGSTARSVLDRAPCDVLVCRG